MSAILKAYLENETAIKRFLTRFFARSQDIDDIAQEAFLKAYASERSQKIDAPRAFLFKVAKNLAINERSKVTNNLTQFMEDLPDPDVLENDSQVPVDEQAYDSQRMAFLSEAITTLPPQCATVFMLRKVHGLSHKQIADQLEISTSTVEKHIAVGVVKLHEYLSHGDYDIESFHAGTRKLNGAQSLARCRSVTGRREPGKRIHAK